MLWGMPREARVYVVRMTVRKISPPIERLVMVRDSISLSTLHRVIQICMGWYDYHLHQFSKDGIDYAPQSDEDDFYGFHPEPETKRLSTFFRTPREKALYEYDYGDGWQVDLTLLDVAPGWMLRSKARCEDARRAGPLEDSGGPHGYQELIETLADPDHEEHARVREWAPEGFDPEAVDLDLINRLLAAL